MCSSPAWERTRSPGTSAVGQLLQIGSIAEDTTKRRQEDAMFVVRFSYDFLPAFRSRAIDFITREVEAAKDQNLVARLLVPLTRGPGGCALQFEIELERLDLLEQFREQGVGTRDQTADYMKQFSEILTAPPTVEILRIA
jgi:hypothetical protein